MLFKKPNKFELDGANITKGGFADTPQPYDAFELVPCICEGMYQQLLDATQSEDLKELVDCLKSLDEGGYCLLGSRGYVYDLGVIAGWLMTVPYGKFVPLQSIPRTLGLRKACQQVWQNLPTGLAE